MRPAPLCVSDPWVAFLEDAQFTVGEGPCAEAFRSGLPVSATSFGPETSGRWPSFAPLAVANGTRAVFAYPLTSVGANVGVLSVYQRSAGALSDEQHADCLALVEVITETMLSLQDLSPPGELARELDDAVAHRAEVYQASGIVAVQLGVPADEALVRMRAHAFATDQPLDAVASAIVHRRLRLDGPTFDGPAPNGPAPAGAGQTMVTSSRWSVCRHAPQASSGRNPCPQTRWTAITAGPSSAGSHRSPHASSVATTPNSARPFADR